MEPILETLERVQQALQSRFTGGGCRGQLSSSALSTAVASMAFGMVDPFHPHARAGWAWLSANQNEDGGWGDTIESPSNISTTTLCWASLGLSQDPDSSALARAEVWLTRECGTLEPDRLAATIRERYGKDQTFSVPILTTCALAGRVGWELVPQLPFEFAACPSAWFRLLNLRVVSYALPALIAIGQVRHHHRPTRNPLARCVRAMTKKRTLRILRSIQPSTGGYLEAAPLTSFVAMSLVSMGLVEHPVVSEGLGFLDETVREDGSWPIDTNLDTWTTTLALQGGVSSESTLQWLLSQQFTEVHPYTGAAPGGWAWTDRAGGVPDADDTAGVLCALSGAGTEEIRAAGELGVRWLLDLQNADGGIPTFCRGWGKLPFDRSGTDLTAHALRAFEHWRGKLPSLQARMDRAQARAVRYILREQRGDGAWVPLWFGNQQDPLQENPIYGTSRVLLAIAAIDAGDAWQAAGRRAIEFLLAQQGVDGGFGVVPSIEETALAVDALGAWVARGARYEGAVLDGIEAGCEWLITATDGGRRFPAAPIGLYFARLWYHEELYPLVFTASALDWAWCCLGHNESEIES